MFNNTTEVFNIVSKDQVGENITYQFKTDEGSTYNVYFTKTFGFVEVSFDDNDCRGFDILTADGYMRKKANTVAKLMLEYEANETFKAFWWIATPQRFNYYKGYFNKNKGMLKKYRKYYEYKLADYGIALLAKRLDFQMIREIKKLF